MTLGVSDDPNQGPDEDLKPSRSRSRRRPPNARPRSSRPPERPWNGSSSPASSRHHRSARLPAPDRRLGPGTTNGTTPPGSVRSPVSRRPVLDGRFATAAERLVSGCRPSCSVMWSRAGRAPWCMPTAATRSSRSRSRRRPPAGSGPRRSTSKRFALSVRRRRRCSVSRRSSAARRACGSTSRGRRCGSRSSTGPIAAPR